MNQTGDAQPRWIQISILLGAGLFLIALIVSAIIMPQIRVLHVLQSLVYVAVVLLTRRNSSWGYGAGVVVAIAWNCLSLFVTHLFQTGLRELYVIVHTGHVTRPDALTVMVGGIGHFILIFGCMAGFLRLRPNKKHWLQFVGGGFMVVAYMALIIFIAAPRP